jgi:hypothetical protein
VLVNGRIVKHEQQLIDISLDSAKHAVAETVDYARSTLGEQAWAEGMRPELPPTERIPNPYTYTDYGGSEVRHRAQARDAAVHTDSAVYSTEQ